MGKREKRSPADVDPSPRHFLGVFVVLAALYLSISQVLGTSHFLATVTSDSMRPTLERGDWVVLEKKENYSEGDVIVFSVNGNTYAHRLAAKTSGGFRTKGDANPYVDLWTVPQRDVLGRVVFRIPLLGHASLALEGR